MATVNLYFFPKTLPQFPLQKTPKTLISPYSTLNSSSLSNSNSISSTHISKNPKQRQISVLATVDGDYSGRRSNSNEQRETIMLPGCDYNHWLIVMEFPKDIPPTREQMIDTYLNTLASVLGSMEEAKKNMYAFSTTTYTGFQCTVSEETSEKFKGLPGVLWVLPDSYIDVKNKDYGGDKYVDGEIIPSRYPTYQPKSTNRGRKYESKAYVRQRDGPPADKIKPKEEQATTSEPSSS